MESRVWGSIRVQGLGFRVVDPGNLAPLRIPEILEFLRGGSLPLSTGRITVLLEFHDLVPL